MIVKSIKYALLGATALAGTVTIAAAADLGRYEAASMKDVAYVQPFNWTGFYLGGHAGGGWGDADTWIPSHPTFTVETSGFVGGVHGGYNHQMGRLVLGIEGDWSASNVDGDHLSGGSNSERYSVEENWRASIRGRVGYAADRALFFATAGVAWVDLDTQYLHPGSSPSEVRGTTATGFTVGGGAEYALSNNWSLRGEYLYSSYDTERFAHNGPSDVDYTTHELRAGISYKFGGRSEPLK